MYVHDGVSNVPLTCVLTNPLCLALFTLLRIHLVIGRPAAITAAAERRQIATGAAWRSASARMRDEKEEQDGKRGGGGGRRK